MYGTSTYIYHKNQPNVGKYTIHGSYIYLYLVHICYISYCVYKNHSAPCTFCESFWNLKKPEVLDPIPPALQVKTDTFGAEIHL